MQPGEETGWHEHGVPMFGYILEGELTVDYGAEGTRVYRKGDAVIEAIDTAHNGRNTGSGVARILAVFMGADGVANTTKVAPSRSMKIPRLGDDARRIWRGCAGPARMRPLETAA